MARVPRIDSPCPLSVAEQWRINGHCGRCNKPVHVLDGLDETQRRALLATAKDPLCVSYRVPVKRAPAIGVAMAAMLSASAAMAGQNCDDAKPVFQSVESAPVSQFFGAEDVESERLSDEDIIITGGIQSAQDAQWIDDSRLPDLPIVVETEAEQSADRTAALNAQRKPR